MICFRKEVWNLDVLLYGLEEELIDEEEFQSLEKKLPVKAKETEQQIINRKKAYNDLEDIFLSSKENGLQAWKI